jgi:2-desacetyl-2-hydroxyethyl bacteriochlorophyllide A dehydrogenase
MNREVNIIGPQKVEIREAKQAELKKGEALLKLIYGGICGSDLNTYRGASAYVSYPRIPGHELAAEIVEIEENDKGLKVGDIVTVNPYFNCGTCYSCERGLVNACMDNQTMGVQREGGFMTYLAMDINRLFKAEGLSAKETVLVEPFCIGYHGVKIAQAKKGEKVLILGAGSIGIFAMFSALHFGADVYMADISEEKLALAKSLGAKGTILNSSAESFDKQVAEITNGNGFDVTVEAVGMAATFQNCIDAAAFGGRVILIGISKQNLDFNFTMIQKKELMIHGSRNALKSDFEEVIEIIKSKEFDILKVVTNEYDFDDVCTAFDDMFNNAGKMLKTILKF